MIRRFAVWLYPAEARFNVSGLGGAERGRAGIARAMRDLLSVLHQKSLHAGVDVPINAAALPSLPFLSLWALGRLTGTRRTLRFARSQGSSQRFYTRHWPKDPARRAGLGGAWRARTDQAHLPSIRLSRPVGLRGPRGLTTLQGWGRQRRQQPTPDDFLPFAALPPSRWPGRLGRSHWWRRSWRCAGNGGIFKLAARCASKVRARRAAANGGRKAEQRRDRKNRFLMIEE